MGSKVKVRAWVASNFFERWGMGAGGAELGIYRLGSIADDTPVIIADARHWKVVKKPSPARGKKGGKKA